MIEELWSERAKRDSTVGVQDESPVTDWKIIEISTKRELEEVLHDEVTSDADDMETLRTQG